jgi:hypothetical protein
MREKLRRLICVLTGGHRWVKVEDTGPLVCMHCAGFKRLEAQ